MSFFFAFRLIWYFIAQQVQFNEEKGRHMVATNNIKGGQTISADLEPLAFIIFDPLQGITRLAFVLNIHIPYQVHQFSLLSKFVNIKLLNQYRTVQCMLQYPNKVLNTSIVNILKYHYQYDSSNDTGPVSVFYKNT